MVVGGSPPVRVGRRQANERVPKRVLFFVFQDNEIDYYPIILLNIYKYFTF
jgi:hypothetical protein